MNPAIWLERTARKKPAAQALFSGSECVATYAEFTGRASGIAAALVAQGIQKGDHVALYCTNCTEYLEVLYGIWWSGAVAVPINAKLHVKEAEWIIANASAQCVFGDDASVAALQGHLGDDVKCVSVETAEFHNMRSTVSMMPPQWLDRDEVIWLFYTSGTTGRPKGVMITAGNIEAMTHSYFVDVDDVFEEDAILYAAPMSHGAGIYNFMHVLKGARHVVPQSRGFDSTEILSLAPQIGSVSMFAAPTMVRRLVDAAKGQGVEGDGLRTIIYAGGPMYEADNLDAVQAMGPRFVQVYGQGECPMGITALSRDDIADRTHPRWRSRLNSVGCAQSSVQVEIVDPDGQELPLGEVGEIIVRGQTVMKGYWQNNEATQKTIRDGWLWTGDMGFMDADGYVTMQDRSKDMIISGGSNVYPREVEQILLSHAAVHEVAVVGKPDAEWGEVIVAFVVRHPDGTVDPKELDDLCIAHIARFKRPKHYRFVDTLPKNNYGKVLKTELRALLSAETTPA